MDLLTSTPFATVIWLLPAVIAQHKAEQWNILAWYARHFVDLPPKTNASIRAFLVFLSLLGLAWTAVPVSPGNPTVAAVLISPLQGWCC